MKTSRNFLCEDFSASALVHNLTFREPCEGWKSKRSTVSSPEKAMALERVDLEMRFYKDITAYSVSVRGYFRLGILTRTKRREREE